MLSASNFVFGVQFIDIKAITELYFQILSKNCLNKGFST